MKGDLIKMELYDFSGWATRANLKCSDGRVIMKDAFKHNDGKTVPLVWNHQHNDPLNILGHALLKNKDEGVYAYCKLNDTESGNTVRELISHGDISALSIYANNLKQNGPNVIHGAIREVSLVLSGANPGAFIDSVIKHGEQSEEEAIIYTDMEIELYHSDDDSEDISDDKEKKMFEDLTDDEKKELYQKLVDEGFSHAEGEDKEETVQDVFDTLTDKQKTVVYALIGQALEGEDDETEDEEEKEGDDSDMKHNVFDAQNDEGEFLQHSEMVAIFSDAKRIGSLKESTLQHGITNIDWLFPEAKNLTTAPTFIKRPDGWVQKVMSGVHKTPFSRIKSMFADLTEDDARAKGYIKGDIKKEQVFGLLKRSTSPTTIYKKQKLDRDDVIDIVDFDVVAWIKSEMRGMLDEEIARAILVGDGRLASSDEKIPEDHIRPIWKDESLFVITKRFEQNADGESLPRNLIKNAIRSRKDYKGSGNPTFYTTEDMLTELLLIEDLNQRFIYESVDKLATVLRVKEIVTVPVMENLTRSVEGVTYNLAGIIVNLDDYSVGADKGGAVNMFDDFDIDYNAQKYLIETRCSGALTKPYSAIVLEYK